MSGDFIPEVVIGQIENISALTGKTVENTQCCTEAAITQK